LTTVNGVSEPGGREVASAKDQWTRAVKQVDGTVKRERNEKRWGRGKRWLGVWLDPSGVERSKAFDTKVQATRYANAMETDIARGEYIDPQAGKARFGPLSQRWLTSRIVDPSTLIRYETALRLHVDPVFGRRQSRSIKPSEIAGWLADLDGRFGPATARTAFVVLHGTLELAVDDDTIKRNPAKARVVKVPSPKGGKVSVWRDETVQRIVERHPVRYRPIPILAAAAGLRQGELFGLAEEDIDFDEMVIYMRRQVKMLGKNFVFALPKNDRERTVPMSEGAASTLRDHIDANGPRPYTLPWEKTDGKPLAVKILFRWRNGQHIRSRAWDECVWKPILAKVGVIPPPTRKARGQLQYLTNRDTGIHALRHYYASISLTGDRNLTKVRDLNPGLQSLENWLTNHKHDFKLEPTL
jgi:integrase